MFLSPLICKSHKLPIGTLAEVNEENFNQQAHEPRNLAIGDRTQDHQVNEWFV